MVKYDIQNSVHLPGYHDVVYEVFMWNDMHHNLCSSSIHSHQPSTSLQIVILNSRYVQTIFQSLPQQHKLHYRTQSF